MTPGLHCPTCGHGEEHPTQLGELGLPVRLIRAYKVQDTQGRDWSQCLVCAGYYDAALVFSQSAGDPARGWFTLD